MPFLPPNQQCQSTAGKTEQNRTAPEVAQRDPVGAVDDKLLDGLLLVGVPALDVGDVPADARVVRVQQDGVGQGRVVDDDALAVDDVAELFRRHVDHRAAAADDHVAAARWRQRQRRFVQRRTTLRSDRLQALHT